MVSNKIVIVLKNFFVFFLILFFLQSCEALKFKKSDVKNNPINDAEKRQKNINEGKGITLGTGKKNSGTFDFATSNEMWRGAIEILDFVPLATADYGGGIIITDWYADDLNSNESIKIMINFLSNEIRADGLKVKIYKKVCNKNLNCNTQLLSSGLNDEIKLAVLKKAAQIKTQDRKKNAEDNNYRSVPIEDKN
ncbi:DUF3576 domain-containing protein [Candidatus Pelagibacter sp.]|nr:DUF3576 domain-containing protein [Candidatus Pelagibacter sp.]